MRRRHFSKLAALGLAGIAGCAESGTQTVGGGDGQGNSPTATATGVSGGGSTGTPTATSSPTSGSASISIASDELVIDEGSYSTEAYVDAKVVNEGTAHSGEIELIARFYDADGNFLDEGSAYLRRLKPGETWLAVVHFLGDGSEVDSHKLEGKFVTNPPNFSPDGVEVLDSTLDVSDHEAIVEGRLKNSTGGTLDYIEAIGIFYADETTVIGSAWTNQNGIPDGETWKFTVRYLTSSERLEKLSSHEMVASRGF